jgi:multiple sugar transport system permease protein
MMAGSKRNTKILSWVVIVAFLVINIFPFFWILITSFKPVGEIFGNTAFQVIPNDPTIANYLTVLFDKDILHSVGNSLIVSTITTIYVVVIASMSAYIIARFKFRGKGLLMGLILGV